MAHKQVGARTQGDVYQGLFFWHQAALLLKPNTKVCQVDIEHDKAAGVDDVAVFYTPPGKSDGSSYCTAEFYQLKHHVDQRAAYSADMIIDPNFLGQKSTSSLLQRFHNAYKRLTPHHTSFLLKLVSNWQWEKDDAFANSIRESDSLPEKFYSAGPRSDLGKVRKRWREHLELTEDEFRHFAECLRFKLNFFAQRDFEAWVFDRLETVGLKVPQIDQRSSPYDSLIQQFLMSGPNSFTPMALRNLCEREALLVPVTADQSIRSLAVRSFLRFAENIEVDADEFVCITTEFEGRHPRQPDSWQIAGQTIASFLSDVERRQRLRAHDHAVVLECHGSAALIAGYELSINSGCNVFPLQKPGRTLWKPSQRISQGNAWQEQSHELDLDAEDIAVGLSVTRDITADVLAFLNSPGAPHVRSMTNLMPTEGVGYNSVKGANHAYSLAADLVTVFNRLRSTPKVRIHLFTSTPNALLFFLGQFREALRRLIIYEYDFGAEKHCTYEPSIELPLTLIINHHEVTDGTEI